MTVSAERRAAVRTVYGGGCGYCGVSETAVDCELQIDHFHPLSYSITKGKPIYGLPEDLVRYPAGYRLHGGVRRFPLYLRGLASRRQASRRQRRASLTIALASIQ